VVNFSFCGMPEETRQQSLSSWGVVLQAVLEMANEGSHLLH
jgi:hypothetical protein